MTPQEKTQVDPDDAIIKSGELVTLLRLINEMEVHREASDDYPEYINNHTLGAMRSASIVMGEQVTEMIEDLAEEIDRIKGDQK